MSRPIYKITSKVVTEMLEKEVKRKEKHIKKVIKAVKKEFPQVVNVVYREDSWDNKIYFRGVIFDRDFFPESSLWKKHDDSVIHEGKIHYVYSPKRNSKKGKELYSRLFDLMPTEQFFQDEKLLDKLGYKPKGKINKISANKIRVTTFNPGYKREGKKYTFIFGGYDGYKPVRGVKEMLMSEYQRMFK
jgi:hypothetical protein